MLALNAPEIPNAAANINADVIGIIVCDLQATIIKGFIRGGDCILSEGAHRERFFFLDVVERIEVLNFAGEANWELTRIKFGDCSGAAFGRHQTRPSSINAVTKRSYQSQTGDGHSTFLFEVHCGAVIKTLSCLCSAEYRITYRMVCIIYNLPAGRISVVSRMLEQIRSTILLNHRTPISWRRSLRSPTEASARRQSRPIVQSPQEHVAASRTVRDRN